MVSHFVLASPRRFLGGFRSLRRLGMRGSSSVCLVFLQEWVYELVCCLFYGIYGDIWRYIVWEIGGVL